MQQRTALIGHTGFVGGTLDQPGRFTDRYNSRSIDGIRGHRFDHVVCAGVSARKWVANREPEADWAGIQRLIDALDAIKARKFTLISTIDVYPDPSQPLDETAVLDGLENHAYGRNRLRLEGWVRQRFPQALMVRLPALFGPGLRKNALFDLLNDNQVDRIDPDGVYQWYPVERTWDDVERARRHGLTLVNLFTEPVPMRDIIARFFPDAPVRPQAGDPIHYRLKTRYAAAFGAEGEYRLPAGAVLDGIGAFVAAERRRERDGA
ncbi:NAD-dependent epimerase/dehydratase family protein [Oleisolibacter albus]|uniref:NAD-dependent epimerase/dehydratase family protein n=1 Tax=Oleisolibacter albus TaxID=2171757 RepID=UPI000DF2F991|nr:NAD-dependent epimerase/dehydratase family protein [Oleisolibacter albus]